MSTTAPPRRESRLSHRLMPRPRVSTTALLIGYLVALGLVALLGGWLSAT